MNNRKLLLIILTVILSLNLVGCFLDFDTTTSNSSKYEFVGETRSNIEYSEYLGYSVEITGKLKNTTNRQFSYVSVTFGIYDSEGNQLDTAIDNMNYLDAGETWQFKAVLLGWLEIEPKSYKVVDVTVW